MRRRLTRCALALAILTGCGDDTSDGRAAPPEDADAATARVVCEGLRAHDNALADTVNEAVAGIGAMTPEARVAALRGGFASTSALAEAVVVDIGTWPIPDGPERDDLVDELRAGAEASVVELADELATFGSPGQIPDGEVPGSVGQLFNAVEKAMSVIEPRIARFERVEFRRAFLDEPACRHVIQPFTID